MGISGPLVELERVCRATYFTSLLTSSGNDMVGAYALQTWDNKFVKKLGLDLLDMDPFARGQFYK